MLEYRGVTIRWVYNLYTPKTGSADANEREMEQLERFKRNADKRGQLGIVINDWKRAKGSKVDFARLQEEVQKVLEDIKRRIDNGSLKPGDPFFRKIWLNKP